jgi:sugar lactone lactonase YvrE
MPTASPSTLLSGLVFPEAARWHEGRLWFSDMQRRQVVAVDEAGHAEVMAETPGPPSGLGWLPDGRLLVVSMEARQLLRQERDGAFAVHADLSALVASDLNDMVVDARGRAYVGNFGYAQFTGERPPTTLVLVTPGGEASVVADGLIFPNGAVVTPGGNTLIVAETWANRLTAFDVAPDGTLANRRAWAELGQHRPDGICLDAEGAIWMATTRDHLLRVAPGGSVLDRVDLPGRRAFACALGGGDGRTLFMLTVMDDGAAWDSGETTAQVESVRVNVPGAPAG